MGRDGRFNSRPPCDGRHDRRAGGQAETGVSIHARLATGDHRHLREQHRPCVSIHARLATGDWCAHIAEKRSTSFQFTPALRRATLRRLNHLTIACFNSRPPCDGRPRGRLPRSRASRFNSRPPCDGRPGWSVTSNVQLEFQFTPALRRATARARRLPEVSAVSIHARLATGDRARRRIWTFLP